MAAAKTARHRALIGTRSVRRVRQHSRLPSHAPVSGTGAIQVFVSRLDAFLGTELFSADVPVIVGRHRDALLRLKDEAVSRQHLQITLEHDQLFIEEMGSANGTLVNRRRIAGRVLVRPSDAIQIGPYTLRLRALLPRSDRARESSGLSEAITKVEAVLSGDGSNGTEDSAVNIADSIDWRLYEEAIRRATGGEPAKNVIQLRVVSGESQTIEDERHERFITNRDPQPYLEGDPSGPRTERAMDIDSIVEARIEQFDRAVEQGSTIRGTTRAKRPETKPERGASVAMPIPPPLSEDTQDPVWSATPSAPGPASSKFEIVPSQHMFHPERDAHDPDTITSREPEEIGETEIERAESISPLSSGDRTPRLPSQILAQSLMASTPPPPPPPSELGLAAGRPKTKTRIPARLVTPSSPQTSAKSPLAPPPVRAATVDRTKSTVVPPPLPQKVDRSKSVALQAGALAHLLPAAQVPPPPAPAPAPAAKKSSAPPPPAPAAKKSAVAPPPLPKREVASYPPPDAIATEQVPEADLRFDAVEITARCGDKLLDIATLRKEGEQYVLGHRTPQGAVAPHSMHTGLRLLRITNERFVDLVFPNDVAGHLMRDGETVMLRELTEGRKYSCLRLKARDVATVILGQVPSAISYHIRFIRVPRAFSTARKLR